MHRISVGAISVALLTSFQASPAAPLPVQGFVRTRDGLVAPRLSIAFVDAQGHSASVEVGGQGAFVADLAPGRYEIRAPRGFVAEAPEVIVPDSAGPIVRDIVLAPAPIREDVLVAATRVPVLRSTLGVATTVLDQQQLQDRASLSVLDILSETPGFASGRTGGVGAQASTFLRGGEARFTRVLVDGVPVNEPGGYLNLGTFLAADFDHVEIVRGSVSTLYGSDALSGVVDLRSVPAQGVLARLEAGSLRTRSGAFSARREWGSVVKRTASGVVSGFATDNKVPNGDFESKSLYLATTREVPNGFDVRLTLRGQRTEGGTPGQTLFGQVERDARYDRDLLIGALDVSKTTGSWRNTLRLSAKADNQLSRNPLDSGSYTPRFGNRVAPFPFSDFPNRAGYANETSRLFASLQTEAVLGSRHLFVGGVDTERETGRVGNESDLASIVEPERRNLGVFAQDQWRLTPALFATFGARLEHNASTGEIFVPRGSLAWEAYRQGDFGIVLRSSAGTGIKAPSFLESYGKQFFARGNPNLRAERSRTTDVGVDFRMNQSASFEVTIFRHDYRDQIAYKSFPDFSGTFENLARTRATGLEIAAEVRPRNALRIFGQFTRTNGKIVESASTFGLNAAGRPLLRRPKNQGSVSFEWRSRRGFAGATWTFVGKRADSDFSLLDLTESDAHTRVDLRARWKLGSRASLLGVIENASDRQYQDVLGYQALGRRARVQLEIGKK